MSKRVFDTVRDQLAEIGHSHHTGNEPEGAIISNSFMDEEGGMSHLDQARTEIQQASEHAESDVRENLLSIDDGLQELAGGDKTAESDLENEEGRFTEIEEKLRGLMEETSEEVEDRLQNARDELDAYRREQDLA